MARESRARATSKALGGCGIFAVSRHKGDGGGAREIPLEVFRDVGRPPREVPRHVRGTGAARRRKGDGIGPENVTLGPRRGKNRRPREVPRHLQGRCATDSTEGDKSGRRAVSLGVLSGARVMGRPEGETPAVRENPPRAFLHRACRRGHRGGRGRRSGNPP